MEYKRVESTVIIRLDPGEEIIDTLSKIVDKEQIRCGSVTGIGAVDKTTLGIFKVAGKEYVSRTFSGDHEIVSLSGTISTMDDEPYLHLHMAISNENLEMFGGHLNEARISATSEIVLHAVNSEVGRKFNEQIGLNLLTF